MMDDVVAHGTKVNLRASWGDCDGRLALNVVTRMPRRSLPSELVRGVGDVTRRLCLLAGHRSTPSFRRRSYGNASLCDG
jgi:hypothetical protein